MVTHIYREGNQCVNKLANIGLTSQPFTWWDQIPTKIGNDFTRNRLGLPYFCWNKMCLTLPLESFDDNKVLKIVQDHRQNLRSLLGSGRTKESEGINKKEA